MLRGTNSTSLPPNTQSRKAISPPSTPLLASASKKTIERRERRGTQKKESPSKVIELFSGKMEEEDEEVVQVRTDQIKTMSTVRELQF